MLVTFKPEGSEPQSWEWIPGRVKISEAALVEKVYGKTWEQFAQEVQQGSARARQVLLWHLQRRDHPTLRLEDAPDFCADELTIEYSIDELRGIRDSVAKSGMPQADREMALASLDGEIAAAEFRTVIEPEGKATSSSD
ncbi:hypothetical protein OHA21_43855 [Actinoplanes sp. NBC_00393]|uniref:hypothetical protein n=1 Tax=Actinoplanes sp. NBC_00393 TaxID=2975953 RepID=UPI002E2460F9